MAEDLLSSFLCTAVQAFLPAGWSEGRKRSSSHHVGICVCQAMRVHGCGWEELSVSVL